MRARAWTVLLWCAGLAAGCAHSGTGSPRSTETPAATPMPAPAVAPSPASPALETNSVILRIVPDPANVRMWLLARSVEGRYRPFLPAGAVVGTDTTLPDALSVQTAILYAQAEGYAPWAIEFVPEKLSDLFPRLRRLPVDPNGPTPDEEKLAAEVWAELRTQFGPGQTPHFPNP